MKIEGLIVPAITPRSNAGVDLQSLDKLVDFLIEGGVDAIFVAGTTGEFQYLPFEEKQLLVRHALGTAAGRVPILTGISEATLDETLALVEDAEECRPDALVLAPMIAEANPLNLVRRVLDFSSLPIMLYNNPAIHRDKNLPAPIVERFAQHTRIIGIKDSSGDGEYFAELLRLQTPEFSVLQGKESEILASLQAGAAGFVAGVANVNPGLCHQLWIDRNQNTMDEIMALKAEIKGRFPNSISGYKQRLVELGVITSADMFG